MCRVAHLFIVPHTSRVSLFRASASLLRSHTSRPPGTGNDNEETAVVWRSITVVVELNAKPSNSHVSVPDSRSNSESTKSPGRLDETAGSSESSVVPESCSALFSRYSSLTSTLSLGASW